MSDKGNPEKDTIDTGGAAFPEDRIERGGDSAYTKLEKVHDSGMTLLDYFAGQADVPWNAVMETLKIKGTDHPSVTIVVEMRAMMKYGEGMAMIAEKRNLEA